jgi:uncharacterized membrane protein
MVSRGIPPYTTGLLPLSTSLAVALLVAGIVLLIFGLNSADAIQSASSGLLSGHPTDTSVWLIVGGCVCVALGVLGGFRSRRA